MPIASVFKIAPVFDVTSSVPSVGGASDAVVIAAGGAGDAGGPTDVLVFSKAVYVRVGMGDVATYPESVTMIGAVERKGAPTLVGDSAGSELRPQTQTTFEITTDADPGVALGAPLATNDRVEWAGHTLLVVGTAIPQGAGWLTKAVLTL